MKKIKFNDDIFLSKTNEETLIILNGKNDVFWGIEGPLCDVIFSLYESPEMDINNVIDDILNAYMVTKEELLIDVEEFFEALVDNEIAVYVS